MDDLGQIIAGLFSRIEELERRVEQSSRDGRVLEVDAEKGLAKVELGSDDEPSSTHWIPWMEQSGDHESWDAPTVGEPVTVNAPAGEMAMARIVRGAPSDREKRPHNKLGETVNKVGNTRMVQTGDAFELEAAKVDLGAAGGKKVARIGDKVQCSCGPGVIIEGSGTVFAVD